MPGYDKKNRAHQVTNTFFIHNCFGSFFNGILNWFGDEYYPRFNYKVIGTYDKAVEYFKKKKSLGIEGSEHLLPSITLDPMLDFSNDERAGKFFWQYSRYAPGIGVRLWRSIDLKEQDILITPVFSRYQGTFEITFWLSSVYELMDFRTSLLQFCGGFNRWCRPEIFWTYLMLPDAVANYETDKGVKIDWGNTLSEIMHINTVNKHKRVIPIQLSPIWKLESFADASSKYGGDNIAEFKLSASFSYEINLPTYVVVSENVDPSLSLSLSLGSTYTKYPLISPYRIIDKMASMDSNSRFFGDNFNLYKIEDAIAERDDRILEFSSSSIVYPSNIEAWNHIVSGELIYLNDEFISDPLNKVRRDNIVILDKYKPEYLPYLRRACGVLACQDTKIGVLYSKCEIMKKSCVCLISESEKDSILEYDGKMITLDSHRRLVYHGELSISEVDRSDPTIAFNTINNVKKQDAELYDNAVAEIKKDDCSVNLPLNRAYGEVDHMSDRLISDFANGIDVQYVLPYILDSKSLDGLLLYVNDKCLEQNVDYVITDNMVVFNKPPERGATIYIGGELMVIKDSKLVAIYEFTDDDNYNTTEPINVSLPRPIDKKENIIVVSYCGKLEYGRDYTIDFDTDTISVHISPVNGEIIQFFYYI